VLPFGGKKWEHVTEKVGKYDRKKRMKYMYSIASGPKQNAKRNVISIREETFSTGEEIVMVFVPKYRLLQAGSINQKHLHSSKLCCLPMMSVIAASWAFESEISSS
jgi:hypothetical protein